MFRSKAKNKPVYLGLDYKDWRTAWPEVEQLAKRLDSAREQLAKAKEDSWAAGYWSEVVDVLTRKWKLMVNLYQSKLRQKGARTLPYKVKYDWWETSFEPRDVMPRFNIFGNAKPDLDRAWEMAREQFIQKARQGLV